MLRSVRGFRKLGGPAAAVVFIYVLYRAHEFLAAHGLDTVTSDHVRQLDIVGSGKQPDLDGLSSPNLSDVAHGGIALAIPETQHAVPRRDVYAYSRSLQQSRDLIRTAQSLDQQILGEIIGNKSKVVLLDMASIENKGDPAINVGQLFLLGRLDLDIIYYCDYFCKQEAFDKGLNVAKGYNPSDVVVLSTGGGNFGGYRFNDYNRFKMLRTFRDYQFVLLSQSTWFHDDRHLNKSIAEYSSHPDITILLRDEMSYNFTQKHFPAVRSVLAPDMVFNIGHIPRFMPPVYDVVWLERGDGESPGKNSAHLPSGFSFVRQDWSGHWPSPRGPNLIDRSLMMTFNGFLFLQRGKVVVSDRLHGVILAQLLDIPTVVIDNKIRKISSYLNTWASGLERVVMATNGTDAVEKAVQLLHKYGDKLQPVVHGELFSGTLRGLH